MENEGYQQGGIAGWVNQGMPSNYAQDQLMPQQAAAGNQVQKRSTILTELDRLETELNCGLEIVEKLALTLIARLEPITRPDVKFEAKHAQERVFGTSIGAAAQGYIGGEPSPLAPATVRLTKICATLVARMENLRAQLVSINARLEL